MFVAACVVAAACSTGDAVSDLRPSGLAFADPTPTAAAAPRGGTLRVAVSGVGSLDPARANPASPSSMLVADLLFDGLTGYDATKGTVVGVLASSWGLSSDGLTWTFEVDPAATFGDGSPVRPVDVKASIERVAAQAAGSLPGVRLAAVVGYDEFVAGRTSDLAGIVVSGSIVQFRLRAPYAALAELLADPAFGIVRPADVTGTSFAAAPATSGSFVLASRTDLSLTLARTPRSRALLDGVEVKLYADADAAYAAFGRGEVDEAVVPATKVADARAASGASGGSLVVAPQQVSYVYGMNVAAPALQNVALRQAVLRAVDRDSIRTQLFPGAASMTGLIGPGAAGRRDNACGMACSYDAAAAAALVKQAYPSGGVPELHVDYFTDDAGHEAKVADAIVANLKTVGIPATARPHTLAEFGELVARGGAELFRYGWIGSYPSADAYLSPFERRGADNVFSLDDETLAATLEQARRATSDSARLSAYVSAEDRVFALAPVLPLVQYQTALVAAPAVRDLVVAPDGSIDFLRVRIAA